MKPELQTRLLTTLKLAASPKKLRTLHDKATGEFVFYDCSAESPAGRADQLRRALFADRRYDHVFVYHNGAPSYYASRGFRASLRV